MKKGTVIFLFIISIITSCKDSKKNSIEVKDKEIEPKVIGAPKLKVIINAKVLMDDVFEVYFYEAGENTFHPKDFVESKVLGSSEDQDIIFVLPDRIYPERLRFDFGKVKEQKEIQLNTIKLTFGNKKYIFSDPEIKNDFKASKFIDFDQDKMLIKTKEIENKYDPYFYSMKVTNIINYLLED